MLELHQRRGDLVEIENAILNRLALDACVLRTERDDYSLIHLTVINEHYDALQRLLMLRPGVQLDKPTGKLGRTALFIAAERGLEAAVLMLLEGNRHAQADVNARDFEGATPLIVAVSRGHTKVAALLREHGAEEGGRYSYTIHFSHTASHTQRITEPRSFLKNVSWFIQNLVHLCGRPPTV